VSDDREQYGPDHPFVSPEHALAAGMALGAAVKAGLKVEPVLTDAGDYTPRFLILLPGDVTLTVVVPAPETEHPQ
jgi:hypothetical protein